MGLTVDKFERLRDIRFQVTGDDRLFTYLEDLSEALEGLPASHMMSELSQKSIVDEIPKTMLLGIYSVVRELCQGPFAGEMGGDLLCFCTGMTRNVLRENLAQAPARECTLRTVDTQWDVAGVCTLCRDQVQTFVDGLREEKQKREDEQLIYRRIDEWKEQYKQVADCLDEAIDSEELKGRLTYRLHMTMDETWSIELALLQNGCQASELSDWQKALGEKLSLTLPKGFSFEFFSTLTGNVGVGDQPLKDPLN